MTQTYTSDLFDRIHEELRAVTMIDCHEHLQRESEFPSGDDVHFGRLFMLYASSDLVSAGMPPADLTRIQTDTALTPIDRFRLLKPWYQRAWNTAYCEALRITVRDLYGVEDLSEGSVNALSEAMRAVIRPGFTRKVLDLANIDYAMNSPFGPLAVFNSDIDSACFVCDMKDNITELPLEKIADQTGIDILCLDDYLCAIDFYFDHYGQCASAFKVARAYDRPLIWEDVPKSAVERTFNRLLSFNDQPDRKEIMALEDFLLHYLCRKCGEYGLRMKFHTGIQEGNGNYLMNSRAALLTNLFLKYPKTGFDIFHISYPYQDELIALAKNFTNVTVDFCWMWIINPAAGRRALSEMLDAVPANKIHGFGGDYIFVEGTYGHAVIARREIARVLSEKVAERRLSEAQAVEIGRRMLRQNPIENFDLERRRAAFIKIST